MLTVQRYSGRTKSAACLQEAVQQVEDLLGVRPKRRVWLIRERRCQMQERMQHLEDGTTRFQRAKERIASIAEHIHPGDPLEDVPRHEGAFALDLLARLRRVSDDVVRVGLSV